MNTDPKHNPDPAHAILVEVTRGPIVESVHYGTIAVADADLYPDLDILAAGAAEEISVLGARPQAHQNATARPQSAFQAGTDHPLVTGRGAVQ